MFTWSFVRLCWSQDPKHVCNWSETFFYGFMATVFFYMCWFDWQQKQILSRLNTIAFSMHHHCRRERFSYGNCVWFTAVSHVWQFDWQKTWFLSRQNQHKHYLHTVIGFGWQQQNYVYPTCTTHRTNKCKWNKPKEKASCQNLIRFKASYCGVGMYCML